MNTLLAYIHDRDLIAVTCAETAVLADKQSVPLCAKISKNHGSLNVNNKDY